MKILVMISLVVAQVNLVRSELTNNGGLIVELGNHTTSHNMYKNGFTVNMEEKKTKTKKKNHQSLGICPQRTKNE